MTPGATKFQHHRKPSAQHVQHNQHQGICVNGRLGNQYWPQFVVQMPLLFAPHISHLWPMRQGFLLSVAPQTATQRCGGALPSTSTKLLQWRYSPDTFQSQQVACNPRSVHQFIHGPQNELLVEIAILRCMCLVCPPTAFVFTSFSPLLF